MSKLIFFITPAKFSANVIPALSPLINPLFTLPVISLSSPVVLSFSV
ncbi:hypothetical protein OFS07_15480 [Brachyspira hyodysenteriae]|nr:hypothetical protein [Brachyspira hyodysenteriae]MDA0066662.1 hypothetical protein [Brachyspira hyodysenteriae]MDA0066684.1 hypothetical protein [Brachyspira hyodysenteriae]MDA0067660.1 hypothetical protein [Brachyspira hyodysenteriae]MDA0071766.1 hypothetical protein [Brachyspira hyodysenteriae]MDA0073001.1 hypothetical protein [Brachyspira hyodysenteriae]